MIMIKTYRHIILLAFVSLLFLGFGQAQVIINEISYNPPESGNDSLEYVEIYNAGLTMVNIGGWHFLAGVEDTFPSIDLQPGGYFVTAFSAQAMMNVFGISVHQWSGGALSNSGELIKLADAGGNAVDSVLFDDADPWPAEPDGSGPSLELKDPSTDNNDGANWQFSGGTTGVIINGFEVSGTPGAENSGGGTPGPDLIIDLSNFSFVPSVAVVAVGDMVRWVNNEGHAHNVNGRQSTFPGNPDDFFSGAPAAGPWQYEFEFLVPGTYHYQCDPHAGMGMTGIIYVYDPLTYNDFTLDELRLTNENGSALFDGVPTQVTGVVHGVNFQPASYSFYIIDGSNTGINVFSFDPGTYVVKEGDELRVSGVIDQFNGLLEIIPDNIEVQSSGNALNIPRDVSAIAEIDEASYLYLDELLVDSVGSISASGFNVYATHVGGSKVLVRVDADANTGMIPENFSEGEWLYVWEGIGTQFDNSFPFTSGYQVLALSLGVVIDQIEFLDHTALSLNPNPATDRIQLKSDFQIYQVDIYTLEGKSMLQQKISSAQAQLDISTLPAGIHMVKVLTEDGIWTSLLSVVR
jgi:plastocyanin